MMHIVKQVNGSIVLEFRLEEKGGLLLLASLDAELITPFTDLPFMQKESERMISKLTNQQQKDLTVIMQNVNELLVKDSDLNVRALKPFLIEKKTPLFQSILENLRTTVSRGTVLSYAEYATKLGFKPSYARVIAKAMSTNDYPIIYPCHRIVPMDGSIGKKFGMKGGLALKQELLLKEGVIYGN